MILLSLDRNNRIREEYSIMDIIDQLYNSHVSTAVLDALDQYRVHKDQALHGYHALKEQLTDDQVAALDQVMDENLNLLADELEQNFRNGFCLGVKMMCEVFGKDV